MTTRWLREDELRIWVRMVAVLELLPARLDSHLRRVAQLTYFDYYVLAMLSEAPGRTLRLSSLATSTNATLPRLSHVVRRLEERGLLVRFPAPDDRRATDAQLTDAGWDKVVATAPLHVEQVRQLVFDALAPDQVTQLGEITKALLAVLDPEGLMSTPYARPGATRRD
jgi:DNA-binding MarR family transcriptional regulator